MIPKVIARHFKPHLGRVLSWDCKLGSLAFFARDVDEAMRAYLRFFDKFDSCEFYCNLNADEEMWYKQAKEGDVVAAYWLLNVRDDREYEGIETMFVEAP